MNSLHKTQSNVIWISSKAEFQISFLNSLSEKWVWQSCPELILLPAWRTTSKIDQTFCDSTQKDLRDIDRDKNNFIWRSSSVLHASDKITDARTKDVWTGASSLPSRHCHVVTWPTSHQRLVRWRVHGTHPKTQCRRVAEDPARRKCGSRQQKHWWQFFFSFVAAIDRRSVASAMTPSIWISMMWQQFRVDQKTSKTKHRASRISAKKIWRKIWGKRRGGRLWPGLTVIYRDRHIFS